MATVDHLVTEHKIVKWHLYVCKVEKVADSDGGGYRIYHPAFGYACYGVGETIKEAERSLVESRESFLEFVSKIEGYELPPTDFKDELERVKMLAEGKASLLHDITIDH